LTEAERILQIMDFRYSWQAMEKINATAGNAEIKGPRNRVWIIRFPFGSRALRFLIKAKCRQHFVPKKFDPEAFMTVLIRKT